MLLGVIVAASIWIFWKADKERMLFQKKGYHLIESANIWWFSMVWLIYGAMEASKILSTPYIYEKSIIFFPLEIILLLVGIWKTAGESFWLAIPISILRFVIIGLPLCLFSMVVGYLMWLVLGGIILLVVLVMALNVVGIL